MNTTNIEEQTAGNDLISKIKRGLFFTMATYFIFYCNSYQFPTAFAFGWLWDILVPLFAKFLGNGNVIQTTSTGSGDTLFNYYQLGLFLFLSLIIGSILAVKIKKPKTYNLFIKWFFMLVRYYVICQMLIYGFSKILYLQFQYPSDLALETRLGDKSPMGLLWTFMGYSKGYTMFTGWLEFFGGVFLLFRRTTILGALMSLGVMINVMMLNYCYDVPVKILSTHLVLLCGVLLIPVMKDVWQFFFTRDAVKERSVFPFFDYRDSGNVMLGFKVGIMTILTVGFLGYIYNMTSKEKGEGFFDGKYEIENFVYDNQNDDDGGINISDDWLSMNIGRGYAGVKTETSGDDVRWYKLEEDSVAQSFTFMTRGDSAFHHFQYLPQGDGVFEVSGRFYNDSLSMTIKESNEEFLLKTRKFNWVQEYPFNR